MSRTAISGQPHRMGILLRNGRLRQLWCAHLISMLGDGLYSVALPWLVYQHTHSAMATAATLAATAVPYFLVGLVAGVYVDRWSRRATMIGADLARAAALTLFPLLLLRGFHLWLAIAMALLLPAASRFFAPAQRASVPALVSESDLQPANALLEAAGNAAYVGGPALAGVLIALWGSLPLFFIDSVSFLASALLLLRLPLGRGGGGIRRSVAAELGEGLQVIWRTPTLRTLLLLVMFVMPCFAAVPALLPLWTQHTLGNNAHAYGLLTTAFFTGSLLGAFVMAQLGSRLASGSICALSVIAMGLSISGLGLAHRLVPGVAALLALGGFTSALNVAGMSLLQRFSPRHVLGRVLASQDAIIWSLRPAGVFISGAAADAIGVYTFFTWIGGAVVMLGVAGTASQALRGVDAPNPAVGPAEEPALLV